MQLWQPGRMDGHSSPMQSWFYDHPLAAAAWVAFIVWIPATAFVVITTRRWEAVALVTLALVALLPFTSARFRRDVEEMRRRDETTS